MKLLKKFLILFFVLVLLIILSIIIYLNHENNKQQQLLENIKNHYSEYATTKNDAILYKLEGKNYIEAGKITQDSYIVLNKKENISINDKYFKLANIDYYIYYEDIIPSEEKVIDYGYKNYIPFDFDIITKKTRLYIDGRLVYIINESMQFPVIINDENCYYVEYDNRLYQIKKEDVESIVDVSRKIEVADNIGVLAYHFFYDDTIGEECNEVICLKTSKFEEHLKYLKENNFYTATMQDMNLWMRRKIQLPKKTTVLTVDDGAMGTSIENGNKLGPLLEKYNLHATLFLITAWWPKENYIFPNLEIQSHGNNIHNYTNEAFYKTKEELLEDFKLSIDKLSGENTAFCYPYYAHNETIRSAVKENGFKIAFAGGNVKVNQNVDPYQINRYEIHSYITLEQFINMVE